MAHSTSYRSTPDNKCTNCGKEYSSVKNHCWNCQEGHRYLRGYTLKNGDTHYALWEKQNWRRKRVGTVTTEEGANLFLKGHANE